MRRFTLTSPAPLEYTITNRKRVTRRLHMELDKNGGLVVVAPRNWSKAKINTVLTQNLTAVERFLTRARKHQRQPLLYTSGEQHLFLGERYPLDVKCDSGRKTSVIFDGTEILVNGSQPDRERVRLALQNWYRAQALDVFSTRLRVIAGRADWVGDTEIPLKLRRMKRTWGNCSNKGVIKLNTHLIKAPLPVLDAVIAHELCHLEEMNHGKAFYALLERLNPNWREDRRRLRSEGNIYLQ